MKYYNIGNTNKLEVIGFYPQTKRTDGYHIDFYTKVLHNSFPDYQPRYGLTLNPKSKATDVIDSANLSFGAVISEKFKILLERFNLPAHRFYPIDVLGTDIKYYWFHYITQFDNYIDFNKTEIEIYKSLPPFEVQEKLILSSYNEIIELKRKLVTTRGNAMRYSSIQLNEKFPNYDLFEVTGAQYFTLISEQLKDEIEKQDITGLKIDEYPNIKL